jgi:leader peptidase (prepilin peptidase)/N-methyltransferase
VVLFLSPVQDYWITGLLDNWIIDLLIYWFLISALIVIFFTDLREQIVPDEVVYPAILIAFLFLMTNYQLLITNYLLSAFGAGLFFLILHLITRRKGMGLGDVKLAILMGLVLGFPKIIVAFYLAFLTGALIGVILILGRKKKFGEQIPFGPFLSGATIVALFWGEEIMKWFTARFF